MMGSRWQQHRAYQLLSLLHAPSRLTCGDKSRCAWKSFVRTRPAAGEFRVSLLYFCWKSTTSCCMNQMGTGLLILFLLLPASTWGDFYHFFFCPYTSFTGTRRCPLQKNPPQKGPLSMTFNLKHTVGPKWLTNIEIYCKKIFL